VDPPTVSLFGEVRTTRARPQPARPVRHRRAKLVAAFVVTALVGVGSFAATYRTMELISVPAPAHGSIVPATPAGATTVTVPEPAPSQPQP
jgi:hypothetical protein